MIITLVRIDYTSLNSRQKEAYNFQKLSAILADYGFCTIRLSDDWSGGDFIAQHLSGEFLRVQLKSRLSFAKKYAGKNLWICFPSDRGWYLYPHDLLLSALQGKKATLEFTQSWTTKGAYGFRTLGKQLRSALNPYLIAEGGSPE